MRLMGQLGAGQSLLEQDFPTSTDPFDLEGQKRMLEAIRLNLLIFYLIIFARFNLKLFAIISSLQNIQQNMESALEYMPEAFGNVVMLYIDCQVNGHHVKAFVDSGEYGFRQMNVFVFILIKRCEQYTKKL